jgi:hypothetical protein
MDLRLATLKAVSFYFLHNVLALNPCRKLSCGTVVCKHFANYQGYPNYRWDLIWYAKVKTFFPLIVLHGTSVSSLSAIVDCTKWHWDIIFPRLHTRSLHLSVSLHKKQIQCVQKVAALLWKVLEVTSTSVYTGLNPFNFIRKHFLQICLWYVSYVRSYCSFLLIKRASIVTTKCTYRSPSAQRLSERTI